MAFWSSKLIARNIVLQPENSIDVEPGVVTLIDQSRYRNNGTFVNAPTWTKLPSGLWVLNFDSAALQYINCGNDVSLNVGVEGNYICFCP